MHYCRGSRTQWADACARLIRWVLPWTFTACWINCNSPVRGDRLDLSRSQTVDSCGSEHPRGSSMGRCQGRDGSAAQHLGFSSRSRESGLTRSVLYLPVEAGFLQGRLVAFLDRPCEGPAASTSMLTLHDLVMRLKGYRPRRVSVVQVLIDCKRAQCAK